MLCHRVAYHHLLRGYIGSGGWPARYLPEIHMGGLVFLALAVCVQPGVVEELFFRCLALGILRGSMGDHAAVMVSSIMFGARESSGHFQLSSSAGALILVVEGAQITLLNIYDRPLQTIRRVIEMYWKGVALCPVCKTEIQPTTGPACSVCFPAKDTEIGRASDSL